MQKKQKTTTVGKFQAVSLLIQCLGIVSRLPKSKLRESLKFCPMLPDLINGLFISKFKYFECRGRLEGVTPEPCSKRPEATPECSESCDECRNPIMRHTTNLGGLINNCSLSYDKENKLIHVSIEHTDIFMGKIVFSIKIDPSMEDLGFGPECIKNSKGEFADFSANLRIRPPSQQVVFFENLYPVPMDADVNLSFKGGSEWNMRIDCEERPIWCEFTIDVEDLKIFISLSQ